jgi:hypothetical protein
LPQETVPHVSASARPARNVRESVTVITSPGAYLLVCARTTPP